MIDPEICPNDFRISDMGSHGDVQFDAYSSEVAYNSVDGNYLVVWRGKKSIYQSEIILNSSRRDIPGIQNHWRHLNS